jgi:hypothetical protein
MTAPLTPPARLDAGDIRTAERIAHRRDLAEARRRRDRGAQVAAHIGLLRATVKVSSTGRLYPAFAVPSASEPDRWHIVTLDPVSCTCDCWLKGEGKVECTHIEASRLYAAIVAASAEPAIQICAGCKTMLPPRWKGDRCIRCIEDEQFGPEE